ncbi:hypothetical protein [Variovorax boronicumulans]|uniref:hypothetical protein n=1 Tax=Variovorax boronicumulans TaxID=436515 RepID=UPI0033988B3B
MTQDEALANETEAVLRAADEAIARQDWAAARRHVARGLEAIGDRYVSPAAIDSTGTALAAAAHEAGQGREPDAVTLQRDVLHSRIVQLRAKAKVAAPSSSSP